MCLGLDLLTITSHFIKWLDSSFLLPTSTEMPSGDELMMLQSSQGLTKSLLGVMCVVGERVESTKSRKGRPALMGMSWHVDQSSATLIPAGSGFCRQLAPPGTVHGGSRLM